MYRILIKLLGLTLVASLGSSADAGLSQSRKSNGASFLIVPEKIVPARAHRFKIRTVTAGVNLKNTSDLATVESAIGFLQRARKKLEDEGYEIQTLRIATQPLPEYLSGKSRGAALADLKAIDRLVSARNVLISFQPVI